MFRARAALPLIILLVAVAPLCAHPSKPKVARPHSASHANAALLQWLKKQYAYQDGGWQTNDIARVMSRTTADYQYLTMGGQVHSRDETAGDYAKLVTMVLEKQGWCRVKTSVKTLAMSGNQATVLVDLQFFGDLQASTADGYAATVHANSSKARMKDTWVHLGSGWYLARTEEQFNSMSVNTNATINE